MQKNEMEHEITIRVMTEFDNVVKILEDNDYVVIKESILDDLYMIPKEFENSDIDKDILGNKSIRIRVCKFNNNITREIITKEKNFNDNGEILEESKHSCQIEDENQANILLKSLGFVDLVNVIQNGKIFKKDNIQLALSEISGRVYLEIENKDDDGNIIFETIEEMLNLVKTLNIPHDENEYFAQKAIDEIKYLSKKE